MFPFDPNYYFRCFDNFGHLPKYYPPMFGVNYFAKVFSFQNFVSYSTYVSLTMCVST